MIQRVGDRFTVKRVWPYFDKRVRIGIKGRVKTIYQMDNKKCVLVLEFPTLRPKSPWIQAHQEYLCSERSLEKYLEKV